MKFVTSSLLFLLSDLAIIEAGWTIGSSPAWNKTPSPTGPLNQPVKGYKEGDFCLVSESLPIPHNQKLKLPQYCTF